MSCCTGSRWVTMVSLRCIETYSRSGFVSLVSYLGPGQTDTPGTHERISSPVILPRLTSKMSRWLQSRTEISDARPLHVRLLRMIYRLSYYYGTTIRAKGRHIYTLVL